jgi:beta-alanine degradation protein BauB
MAQTPIGSSTPQHRSSALTSVDVLAQAPPANTSRTAPVASRLIQADGGNVIAFTFAPGQSMPEHQAAHPITVQCLSGHLSFTAGEDTVDLQPGVVVHVPARLRHEVACPADTGRSSVLLLTMLTGEARSSSSA